MDNSISRVGKADLHVHTTNGDGMASVQQIFDYVESSAELTVLAITDHDDLRSAAQAWEIWARGHYHFEVVVGAEITEMTAYQDDTLS